MQLLSHSLALVLAVICHGVIALLYHSAQQNSEEIKNFIRSEFLSLENKTALGFRSLEYSLENRFLSLENKAALGFRSLEYSLENRFLLLENKADLGFRSLEYSLENRFLSLENKGDRGYIDACIALGDARLARGNATFEAQARSELGTKCKEGWRMYSAGNLTSPVLHVDTCADMFAGSTAAADDCVTGWRAEFEYSHGAESKFIEHCRSFASKAAKNGPSSSLHGSRELCMVGWKHSLSNLAETLSLPVATRGRVESGRG